MHIKNEETREYKAMWGAHWNSIYRKAWEWKHNKDTGREIDLRTNIKKRKFQVQIIQNVEV